MACAWFGTACAQLQLLPDQQPQCVFVGDARKIAVVFHNQADKNFESEIRTRIFQAGSATGILLSDNAWKRLQVPAGETVLDSAALNFPAVNAETRFLVQWLEETNRVIGVTQVLVYPTNLFQALPLMLGGTNFGVLDPNRQLVPLLQTQGIHFIDLGQMELDDFSGKLAVIGPFKSKAQMPEGLAKRIETIAKHNVAVVWIQPPAETTPRASFVGLQRGTLLPSFYSVQKNRTAVIIVQPEWVADLAENPQSQLNLVYFCKLALNPQPPGLPGLSPP
jgi:hypothetical protein